MTRSLRIDFLRQTLSQEIAFFDSAEGGSVANHVSTSVNLVNQGISEKLGLSLQAIATFFAAFVVAFTQEWKLTLITFCIVPTIVIVTGICMAIDTVQENQIIDIYSHAGQLAEEVFATIRTAHSFWAFAKLSKQYDTILERAREVGKKKGPNYAVLFSTEFFCIYSGYALAFWRGIHMYGNGEIGDPGRVVTYVRGSMPCPHGAATHLLT